METVLPKPKHSPIRIFDPVSENHVVRVHPTQGFDLVTSSYLGEVELHITSEYFQLVSQTKTQEEGHKFCFQQKFDLTSWSQVSRTYLGCVSLLSENINQLISLSVILEAQENSDIHTVINPNADSLKIEPNNLIEVVLFDSDLPDDIDWEYTFIPDSNSLRLDEVQRQVVPASQIRHEQILRRNFDSERPETHMWFRHDWASQLASTTLSNGTYPGGKLIFDAGATSTYRRQLDVVLQIKRRNAPKPGEVEKPKIIVSGSTSYVQNSNRAIVQATAKKHDRPRYNGAGIDITSSYMDEYGCNGDWRNWHNNSQNKKEKYDPKLKKSIVLKEVVHEDLSTNCDIVYYEDGKLIDEKTFKAIEEKNVKKP